MVIQILLFLSSIKQITKFSKLITAETQNIELYHSIDHQRIF